MTLDMIKERLKLPAYDFLRHDSRLRQPVFVTLGGSHAYGTSTENSDVDIRGCALNSRKDLLTQRDFEQVVETETDTVIYSADKLIKLITDANPNTIELLGNLPEHYFYVSEAGRLLLDNAELFLSKKAAFSFGGYANAQLRRLENKAARKLAQSETETYILRSIQHAMDHLKEHYGEFPEEGLKLYTDKSPREGYDTEMYMDITLKHYPLRDWTGLWSDMQSIVKSYGKLGKRNENAASHGKLGKHMMHLVRLYYMCFDILEKKQIVTYREKEHDLLMSIRNGAFLDSGDKPTAEFYEMLDELEKRMEYAEKHTELPEFPNKEKIRELHAEINGFSAD